MKLSKAARAGESAIRGLGIVVKTARVLV